MHEQLEVRVAQDTDIEAVVALWRACGLTRSFNDPHKDIAFARAGPASQVLVGCRDGNLRAAVMVGHDGHRGAVYYLGVDPGHQSDGLGAQMLRAAEQWLAARGVWKLNLMIRSDNSPVRQFYEKQGYKIEQRIVLSRRLD